MKSRATVLALYNAALLLLTPVLLLKKAVKLGRRGHHHEWDLRRWNAPEPLEPLPPEGARKRAVFVALSFGEIEILEQLSAPLEREFAGLEIVWSIRDADAAQLASRRFPTRKIVPMPFDFAFPTQNWLGAVRPDVLIVVEKFWWPNLVWGAKLRGAKVVLVNGRSRGREKTRYQWIAGFQKWVLSGFDALLFESEAQIERVGPVLPRGAQVIATGNVKFAFATPAPPPDAPHLEKWLKNGNLPFLIAGSTSLIDEKWALDAFQTVRKTMPCALLIAPRRIERAGEVAAQIEARGWKVSRRSAPSENVDVWLLDTLGELSFCYQFGRAAYVGGAVEGRGHNIIEPLSWGVAVGYGPNRGDFEGAQRAAEAAQVGFRMQSSDELAAFWTRCLREPQFCAEVKNRAARLLEEQRGALDLTLEMLRRVLQSTKNEAARSEITRSEITRSEAAR